MTIRRFIFIFIALSLFQLVCPKSWSQALPLPPQADRDVGASSPMQVATDVFLAFQSNNLNAVKEVFASEIFENLSANSSKISEQIRDLSWPRSALVVASGYESPRYFFEVELSHELVKGDPDAVIAAGGQRSYYLLGYNKESARIDTFAFRLDFRIFESNRPAHVFGSDVSAQPMTEAAAALARGSDLDARTVDFLFATTRVRDQNSFSEKRGTTTTFGAVRVRIPEDHKIGNVQVPQIRPGLFGPYQEKLDPGKHFVISRLGTIAKPAWSNIAKGARSAEALVFVHGFNNTFDDAVYRAAQIFWDLQYKGLPVLYSWPSWGNAYEPLGIARSYAYDRDSALSDSDSFLDFLQLLRDELGIRRVNIVAHSMGNFVVLNALRQQKDKKKFGEWVLAAPDIDREQFIKFVPGIQGLVSGMTLYASAADKTLLASMKVARDRPRAGYVDGKPLVLPGMDSIDVTRMGDELFGLNHDTFASNRSLIDDLGLLLDGVRPPNKRLRQIRPVPLNPPPEYWEFAP
jgi:esterase/lipase superfamily enzyme